MLLCGLNFLAMAVIQKDQMKIFLVFFHFEWGVIIMFDLYISEGFQNSILWWAINFLIILILFSVGFVRLFLNNLTVLLGHKTLHSQILFESEKL